MFDKAIEKKIRNLSQAQLQTLIDDAGLFAKGELVDVVILGYQIGNIDASQILTA